LRYKITDGELDENSICAIFAHTTRHRAIEGKTQIKEVKFYKIDMIISVSAQLSFTIF